MAKRYAVSNCQRAISLAMEVHGAMGLSREMGIEQLYRDARMLTVPDGTKQILTLIEGRERLDRSAGSIADPEPIQTRGENHDVLKRSITEQDGPAFMITFNRPEQAQRAEPANDRRRHRRRAEGAASTRTFGRSSFTGGEKVFSAGADLNEALKVKSVTDGDAFFGRANRLLELLESVDKPVLAAIEGFCMTGGCELALACDIRIGAKGSILRDH